jgi:maltose O-acetyltransferase
MTTLQQTAHLLAYYFGARWLPPSTSPGGPVWRAIRRAITKPLFAECGQETNVEHGAYFGSGSLIRIGNRSGIGIQSRLLGPVRIGNDVMMGPNVTILTQNHVIDDVTCPMLEQGFTAAREVQIEDDVWIGMNSIVLPGVRIGKGSVIGAGAVVTRDVPAYSVAVGNPARVVRDRRRQAKADTL